jgi:hypothetical protein
VLPQEIVAWARTSVGDAPVDWVLETAVTVARHVEISTLDVDSADIHDRQFLAELIGLVALVGLHEGRTQPMELVRSLDLPWPTGIYYAPFAGLLRITAQTNAVLADEFLSAWRGGEGHELRSDHPREISRVLYACGLAIAEEALKHSIGELKLRDEAQILARYSLVTRFLESGTPPHDFEGLIGYRIDDFWHQCLFLDSTDTASATLRRAQNEVISQLDPVSSLVIDASPGRRWVWVASAGDRGRETSIDRLPPVFRRVTVGRPHSGRTGFVTSHREATSLADVADLHGIQFDRITEYTEVGPWIPYLADPARGAAFVVDTLGELAAPVTKFAPLRETLTAFLASRSPTLTARELFLTRNSVAYRLRKVDDLLPAGWRTRSLATGLALRLHGYLSVPTLEAALRRGTGGTR